MQLKTYFRFSHKCINNRSLIMGAIKAQQKLSLRDILKFSIETINIPVVELTLERQGKFCYSSNRL